MNAWLHPQGPDSTSTYWLRRGLVIAVVVAVLVALVWGSQRVGRSVSTATPRASTSSTAASSTPASSSAAAKSQTPSSPAPKSQTPSTPAPSGPPRCQPSSLRLGITGARQVRSGATTTYRVLLTNPTATACVVDLPTTPIMVQITSGSDEIWSTADCATWAPRGTWLLQPNEVREFKVTWPTRRSDRGCKLYGEVELGRGTYWVKVSMTGLGAAEPFRTVLYLA